MSYHEHAQGGEIYRETKPHAYRLLQGRLPWALAVLHLAPLESRPHAPIPQSAQPALRDKPGRLCLIKAGRDVSSPKYMVRPLAILQQRSRGASVKHAASCLAKDVLRAG